MKSKLLWFPVAIWLAVLLYFSAVPLPAGPGGGAANLHFAGYFILSALFLSAFSSLGSRRALLMSVMLSTYYGLLMEGFQFFLPGRVMSAGDALANFAGSFFALFLVPLVAKADAMQTNKTGYTN